MKVNHRDRYVDSKCLFSTDYEIIIETNNINYYDLNRREWHEYKSYQVHENGAYYADAEQQWNK